VRCRVGAGDGGGDGGQADQPQRQTETAVVTLHGVRASGDVPFVTMLQATCGSTKVGMVIVGNVTGGMVGTVRVGMSDVVLGDVGADAAVEDEGPEEGPAEVVEVDDGVGNGMGTVSAGGPWWPDVDGVAPEAVDVVVEPRVGVVGALYELTKAMDAALRPETANVAAAAAVTQRKGRG